MALLAVLGGLAAAASGSAVAAPNVVGGGGILTGCYGTKTMVKFLPNPVRILDTRDGTGVAIAGTRPAVTTTAVQTNGVVAGAVAIIGNVTVTNAQPGYLTLYPGGTRPLASTINFNSGWTIANHVQTGLASDGTFQIFNVSSTDIVFDATAGIYPVSKGLRLIDPATETCAADETRTTWNQVGPAGPAGATGATGPQGPPGLSGYHIVSATFTATRGVQTSKFTNCALGEKVLGGGASTPDTQNLDLRQSYPLPQRTIPTPIGPLLLPAGWFVTIANNTNPLFGTDFIVTAYATCANAT